MLLVKQGHNMVPETVSNKKIWIWWGCRSSEERDSALLFFFFFRVHPWLTSVIEEWQSISFVIFFPISRKPSLNLTCSTEFSPFCLKLQRIFSSGRWNITFISGGVGDDRKNSIDKENLFRWKEKERCARLISRSTMASYFKRNNSSLLILPSWFRAEQMLLENALQQWL